MKAAVVAILVFLGSSVQAEEIYLSQKLIQLTNDRDANVAVVEWVTDAAGATLGLRYTSNKKVTDFTLAQLNSGAVLEAQQGVNALTMKGPIDPLKGGNLTFTYVANGMMGSYKSCAAQLTRSTDGEWMLLHTTSRARIQSAKIVTWSMGITTLEGICAN